jgi:drug/metabolite transporter (DMT)-like permease
MSNFTRAVLFIMVAILLFDTQGAIIKHLGDRYSVQQIATFRNLFGLLPSFLVLYFSSEWQAGRRSIRLSQWKLALFRGVAIAVAQFSFYLSLTIMEFATASTLAFAGPLFITTLSIPILHHRVGLLRWIAVIVGFIGIVLVMRPRGDIFELHSLLPVCAAFGYALSSVLVRLFDKESPTATINLYTTFGALFCAVFLMIGLDAYQEIDNLIDWLWMLSMGMAGGFAVLFMIMAYRLTQPSNLSPFEYFGIPFSFVIGYLVFGEAPFGKLFPGVILIVAGGLLIVWRERRKNTAIVTQPKISRRY